MNIGMSDEVAWRTFKFGLAAVGDNQAQRFQDLAKTSGNEVTETKSLGLEVTRLVPGDAETRQFYTEHVPDLRVLGKIYLKEWKCASLPDEDLTDEEAAAANAPHKDGGEEYEFWLEDAVLDLCFVGMKLEATVRQLNCGVRYFDQIVAVYASFYTFLPNERMIGWKEPVPIGDRDVQDEEKNGDGNGERKVEGGDGDMLD